MRIVIAGSSGFIGSRLVGIFEKRGHFVVSWPERIRNLSGTEGDFRNPTAPSLSLEVAKFLDEMNCDAFVNLAWMGLPDYSPSTTAKNAELSATIQEGWARSSCPTYVGFGSCLEYGRRKGPLSEGDYALDADFFGKTKTWLHDHTRALAEQFEKRYLWLRPFWLYGPGQRAASLVPSALRSAREGELAPLRTPNVLLDFVHVDDLCDATAELIEHPDAEGIFNIGSGEPTRVGDIAEMVFSLVTGDRSAHMPQQVPNSDATWSTNQRLADICSWSPSRSVEQYVREATFEQETS